MRNIIHKFKSLFASGDKQTNDSIRELERKLADAKTKLKNAYQNLDLTRRGDNWRKYEAAAADESNAERALAAARGEEHAIPIDFPVSWDIGAPLPYLLRNDYRTFLTFFLRDHDPNWDGSYVTVQDPSSMSPHGIAVVEFKRCFATKMGSPNDEVLHGHPLFGKGLESYTAQEVVNSRWLAELETINSVHSYYKPENSADVHHYILWFHDSTFECLAESFQVNTYSENLSEILSSICEKLLR